MLGSDDPLTPAVWVNASTFKVDDQIVSPGTRQTGHLFPPRETIDLKETEIARRSGTPWASLT